VEYCKKKYGYGAVCSISTKSYAAIKGAMQIAARYLGSKAWLRSEEKKASYHTKKEYEEAQKQFMRRFYQMADAYSKQYDEFVKAESNEDFYEHCLKNTDTAGQRLLSVAKLVTGCFTNYGQHAAGTIISKDNISDCIPLMYAENKENMETQCNMAQAEEKGYLKMDFLGLNNLDIITSIMRKTKDYTITDYNKRAEIINDIRIYEEIYSKGLTQGVFQFESFGMKDILRKFQPECFEDVILLNASYRPGPMQFIPEIIAEKWYRKAIKNGGQVLENGNVLWNGKEYEKPVHSIQIEHPVLQEILEPTYGCIIYQEQIMHICQRLAGFTMGHADNVRKFMSKKKEAKLAAERPLFVDGCINTSGLTAEQANDLFDKMMDFAKYAFNKSHATAYALVSVFTAYLKLYHTAVFYAESLNAVANLDEILDFTIEMTSFHIRLLSPDLLKSEDEFVAVGDVIYYGLSFIKGLSGFSYKKAKTFLDFVVENHNTISESVLIKVAKCGLFDSMETSITRKDLCDAIPKLYKALNSMDKLEEKTENLSEQITCLKGYTGKKRLTLVEKTEICAFLKLRKAPEKLTMTDVHNKIEKLYLTMKEVGRQIGEEQDRAENILKILRLTSKHTMESTLYNRQNELELLGYVFDIEDSLRTISGCEALPADLVNSHEPIPYNIENAGFILLNPCVKVTPGGWIKTLCCDKNRTYKYLYFTERLENTTEFVMTFQAEKLKQTDDGNSYIMPHAYKSSDMEYGKKKHFYMESRKDFEEVVRQMRLGKKSFHPTAYLHCEELGFMHVPCIASITEQILKEKDIYYISYAEK
jgi:DNA polymerase III alpha subunit